MLGEQQIQAKEPPAPNFFQRYRKLIWISAISAAVITAGLLTYILFFRNSEPKVTYEGEVKLIVQAPGESASSSELSYEITIDNRSNSKLTALNLEIFYPRGFTFLDSTPDPYPSDAALEGRKFSFPDLLPQRQRRLVIIGRLEGEIQEVKTLNAKLHYIPENFRSAFVAPAQAQTVILAPDLSLHLEAPPQLVSGQIITYDVQITNTASRSFTDLAILVNYPEKFAFVKMDSSPGIKPVASTEAGETQNQWSIDKLVVGETKKITISGKISEDPGRESFVSAELFVKNVEGRSLSAGRGFAFTGIRSSPLVLTQKLLQPGAAILSGQTLNYEVTYENIGEIGLNNVVISVAFEGSVFDLSKLKSPNGQLQKNSLIWIPAQTKELLVVGPRQRGNFNFIVSISDNLAQNLRKNPKAVTRVEYYSKELSEPIPGNTLEFKVQTEMKIVAFAKPTGEGAYQIDIEVTNGVNDVKSAELLATIPRADAVFLGDSVSPAEEKPNVEFVPIAGTLHWNLGNLFALTGSFHERRKLSFSLKLPSTPSAPTPLPLLKDIQTSGIDDFTGNKVFSNKIENLFP